jgi:hypothetical protein
MSKPVLNLVLGFILLFAAACVPGQPTADQNLINTAVAQTLAAVPSATPDLGIPATDVAPPTATATPIDVQESPTALATTVVEASPTVTALGPAVTMTPIVLFTATPVPVGVAQVTVSVPTNCRVGPGRTYTRVGGLQLGQVAEVVGRNAASTYWIIRNPARPSETCWLWGEYATVTGNTGSLTVYAPPLIPTSPAPAARFDMDDEGLESCAGTGWWVEIGLENTGGVEFRSMILNVLDQDTDDSLTLYTDVFTNRNGCNESEIRDVLPPGASRIVSSPIFNYNPTGHRIRATVTLCTSTGQRGTCITETANLRP